MEENNFVTIKEKDFQFIELKKDIQKLRKQNFQLKLKLESLSEMIWNCFEQLGERETKQRFLKITHKNK